MTIAMRAGRPPTKSVQLSVTVFDEACRNEMLIAREAAFGFGTNVVEKAAASKALKAFALDRLEIQIAVYL